MTALVAWLAAIAVAASAGSIAASVALYLQRRDRQRQRRHEQILRYLDKVGEAAVFGATWHEQRARDQSGQAITAWRRVRDMGPR